MEFFVSFTNDILWSFSICDAAALTALALITGREFFAAKEEEDEKKDDSTSTEQ